jgi:hypothetical protein
MHPAGLRRAFLVLSAALFAVGLLAAPASAAQHRQLVATGSWTDPGAVIDSITPSGQDYIVQMHGETTTDGDFAGTSSYTLTARANLRTGVTIGHSREIFTVTLAPIGTGHVTFDEIVVVKADGNEVVNGTIVDGDGPFAGAHGSAHFIGTTDPSGANPATGTYRIVMNLASA